MEKDQKEEFEVSGEEVLKKIKEIVQAGNAREVLIKDEEGNIVITVPLTIGAVGVLLLPTLAAVGAVAALLTKCTIVVVKK